MLESTSVSVQKTKFRTCVDALAVNTCIGTPVQWQRFMLWWRSVDKFLTINLFVFSRPGIGLVAWKSKQRFLLRTDSNFRQLLWLNLYMIFFTTRVNLVEKRRQFFCKVFFEWSQPKISSLFFTHIYIKKIQVPRARKLKNIK